MPPQKIIAHLADESGLFAQLRQHGQHIAGCSAWIGLKQSVSLSAEPVFSEVDQQLPQSGYIIALHLSFPHKQIILRHVHAHFPVGKKGDTAGTGIRRDSGRHDLFPVVHKHLCTEPIQNNP